MADIFGFASGVDNGIHKNISFSGLATIVQ